MTIYHCLVCGRRVTHLYHRKKAIETNERRLNYYKTVHSEDDLCDINNTIVACDKCGFNNWETDEERKAILKRIKEDEECERLLRSMGR